MPTKKAKIDLHHKHFNKQWSKLATYYFKWSWWTSISTVPRKRSEIVKEIWIQKIGPELFMKNSRQPIFRIRISFTNFWDFEIFTLVTKQLLSGRSGRPWRWTKIFSKNIEDTGFSDSHSNPNNQHPQYAY